jgi:hypothetical protein
MTLVELPDWTARFSWRANGESGSRLHVDGVPRQRRLAAEMEAARRDQERGRGKEEG